MISSAIRVAALSFVVLTCSLDDSPGQGERVPKIGGQPIELAGLLNVIRVSEKLYSGSGPEDQASFELLKGLGIKTILSVDGAKPDAELAKKFDMRYVHLPIGYDGVSQEQALKLAKAVRDLPGPIYLHCHHGKHRSPAAAAAVQYCLDDKCTASQAIDIMKRAGTDPHYVGLMNAPNTLKRPNRLELDRIHVEYRPIVEIPALAKSMVEIDERWEHLSLIRKAGWKTPKTHPDLDPPHEALQLREHYRELARTPAVKKRPADFKVWLTQSEKAAQQLEDALRANQKSANANAVERSFQQSRSLCAQCHAKYRDVPQEK